MNKQLFLNLAKIERIPLYVQSVTSAAMNRTLTYKLTFPGMLSLPQGVWLYKLAKSLPKKAVVVEIGCFGGLSTAFLLAGLDPTSSVYSIDPFDENVQKQKQILQSSKDKAFKNPEIAMLKIKPSKKDVEKRLRKEGFKNFELIQGYSNDIVKTWKKRINLLWIDGNHDYKFVKDDYIKWSPFLKKGGIIAFDDANKRDTSAVWNMGVIGPTKVVDEYIKEPKWTILGRIDAMVYARKNF